MIIFSRFAKLNKLGFFRAAGVGLSCVSLGYVGLTSVSLTCASVTLMGWSGSVYAQSAPVYDADTMQDDGSDQQSQDLPPPPPPEQTGDNQDQDAAGSAFVPMDQQSSSGNAKSSASGNAASSAASSSPSSQRHLPITALPPIPSMDAHSLTLEQRMQRLEQQISNMQTTDAAAQVDTLQTQVQALRGQVEQLTHQVEELKNQQKQMYSDLDSRIGKVNLTKSNLTKSDLAKLNSSKLNKSSDVQDVQSETTLAAASASDLALENETATKSSASKAGNKAGSKAGASNQSQPNVAEEQQIYQTAYSLIKEKKYAEAVNALQGMLKKYPAGQFASNAHYWLAELYGLMNKNDQALTEFTTVIGMYPDSPRVPDAQLKVGLIYASQSQWADAKAALKKVINHYPGSTPARMAAEQLKQIKAAGH